MIAREAVPRHRDAHSRPTALEVWNAWTLLRMHDAAGTRPPPHVLGTASHRPLRRTWWALVATLRR